MDLIDLSLLVTWYLKYTQDWEKSYNIVPLGLIHMHVNTYSIKGEKKLIQPFYFLLFPSIKSKTQDLEKIIIEPKE